MGSRLPLDEASLVSMSTLEAEHTTPSLIRSLESRHYHGASQSNEEVHLDRDATRAPVEALMEAQKAKDIQDELLWIDKDKKQNESIGDDWRLRGGNWTTCRGTLLRVDRVS